MDLNEQTAYVEECCAQIYQQKDVLQIIVMNDNDDPIWSSLSSEQESLDYTGLYGSLLWKARRAVRLLDPRDEVLSIRVHTMKHEAIITPDDSVTFITLQKPDDLFLQPTKVLQEKLPI